MKRKVRQIFLGKHGGDAIEIPAHIKTSLPGGTLLSVTIEYEVGFSDAEESSESHLEALDDVHDTYP
jgi:hypothetical protein